MEIEHLGLGQTVLQLCRPLIDATGHWHALAEKGPHVYNLTYFVDDMSVVLERCAAADIESEWHFPLGDVYKRIIPEENLSGSLEAAMLATRERDCGGSWRKKLAKCRSPSRPKNARSLTRTQWRESVTAAFHAQTVGHNRCHRVRIVLTPAAPRKNTHEESRRSAGPLRSTAANQSRASCKIRIVPGSETASTR